MCLNEIMTLLLLLVLISVEQMRNAYAFKNLVSSGFQHRLASPLPVRHSSYLVVPKVVRHCDAGIKALKIVTYITFSFSVFIDYLHGKRQNALMTL